MRYPHQVPLRNVQHSKYHKFPKLRCKHPQLSHFTGMFCSFLVIPHSYPFFLIYALANNNQFTGIKIKQNVRYFLESNFGVVNRLFVLIYPNQNDIVKRLDAKKYHFSKRIIKRYVIIKGKNFYDPRINSYVKR